MNTTILVSPSDRQKGPLCLCKSSVSVRVTELKRFSFGLQRCLGHLRSTLSTLQGEGPGWQVWIWASQEHPYCRQLYNSLLRFSSWLRKTYWVRFLQRRDRCRYRMLSSASVSNRIHGLQKNNDIVTCPRMTFYYVISAKCR